MSLVSLLLVALATSPFEVSATGAQCEDAQLGERVEYYLAAAGGSATTSAKISADLRRQEGLWRLEFRLGEAEVRTLRAMQCSTVIDAAAFVLAVTIDPTVADILDGPELVEERLSPSEIPDPGLPPQNDAVPDPGPRPPSDSPPETGTRPPPLDPLPPLEPAPEPEDVSPGELGITFGVAVGLDGGALPRVGGLASGRLGLAGPWWRVDAGGHYRTPTRTRSAVDPSTGGWIGAWAVTGRGCGVPSVAAALVEFPVCLGLEAGQILGAGFGFRGARSTRLPWFAIVGGTGVRWRVRPRVALFMHAEIGLAPTGGRLVIGNLGVVHQVAPLVGRGIVGIEGRLALRRRGRSQ